MPRNEVQNVIFPLRKALYTRIFHYYKIIKKFVDGIMTKENDKKDTEKPKGGKPVESPQKPKKTDNPQKGLEHYLSRNGHYFLIADAISEYKSQKGQPGFDPNEVAAKLYKPFLYINSKFNNEMENIINQQLGLLIQNNAVTEPYLSNMVDRIEPMLGKHRDELIAMLPDDAHKQLAFMVLKDKDKRPGLASKIMGNPAMKRPATLLQLLDNVNGTDDITGETATGFYDNISSNNPADYTKNGAMTDEEARSYIEKGRAMFAEGLKALKNTSAMERMKQVILGTTARQLDYEMKKMDPAHVKNALATADPVEVMSTVYHGLLQRPAKQSAIEPEPELNASLPGEPV